MVLQKNADELFQNFVWHTRHIDTDKIKKHSKEAVQENKDMRPSDDKQEGQYHFTIITRTMK
jgi:hypothetical protein